MRPPTGEQFELQRDVDGARLAATITQVGAAIRRFTIDGIDLTEPYPVDATPPSAAGVILVPWPNRVKDGLWQLDGKPQQLALTEPAKHNASHGLLRYAAYLAGDRTDAAITVHAPIYPQPGYPFILDTSVRYELMASGLRITHTLTNAGITSAPVAIGAHPYLKIGDTDTNELRVSVDAATHFETDERGNIIGSSPAAGGPFDLSGGARVGDLRLDDGWGDVALHDGRSAHVVTAPDGRSVTLWGDKSFRYVQVFTSRAFATTTSSSVALAIEPMTAPANALNSGTGLRWLEPGETWVARWGIEPRGFAGL